MIKHFLYLGLLFITSIFPLFSQNESKKWYFGDGAGLDFNTNPPSILSVSSMTTLEGCASISNQNGALLFYTDGATIWSQNHSIMANGSGLSAVPWTTSQPALIIKKPSSLSEYYVITNATSSGIYYSVVDMNLAAGMGSVTVKNALTPLSGIPTTERLTGTRHCNGIDYWIITHDKDNNVYRALLLTPAGFSVSAVTSSIGTSFPLNTFIQGQIKISPNGKKLGNALHGVNGGIELFDFDYSTGVITNSISLLSNQAIYSCEFSPDGTKLYSTNYSSGHLFQWDLCAGSPFLIASSQFTVSCSMCTSLQSSINGKIYIAQDQQTSLGVINSPNLQGPACSFTPSSQTLLPRASLQSLPNFISNYFFPLPSPFTYNSNMAISCNTSSFTAPASVAAANSLCASAGSTVNALVWNFGDPASGPANTSTLGNPVHVYPGPGTYTTQLIIYYQCRSDTLRQPVVITSPTININTSSVTCNGLGTATGITLGGSGSYSYTWSPGSQTTAIASNLSPGMYTLTMFDNGGGCVGTVVVGVSPALISGVISSQSLACNGIATGTAGISVSNGSGNYSYSWSGSPLTTASVNALAAGAHTVTVTDLTNNCSFTTAFAITQPPALTINIVASSATACINTSINLSANATGGTGSYTYTWLPGAGGASAVVTQSNGGTYSYSVNALDANSCSISANTSLSFVNTPNISVSNASICPLQTGTLIALGANTYTWLPSNSSGNSFTQSPMATTQYTVIGSSLSCTAQTTASIVVKALPVPTLSANSPLCNNQSLSLSAAGGTAYVWSGPFGFNSSVQNPVINPVAPNQSGLYSATLTGANACTAAANVSVTVHPTPTLSVLGATLCSNQSASLSAYSLPGASYYWSGPGSFTSNAQFPLLSSPPANLSGAYQLTVTSAQNCSNTASANVTITALPNVSITANSPLCFGSTLLFFGNGGQSYNWSGPNGFSSVAQNPSISAVNFTHAGTYTLTTTTGPCVLSITKNITVNPLPNPIAGYNVPLCELKTLYLAASPAQTYTWSGPQNFSSNLQSPSIASVGFLNTGQYSLSVTDVNGCVGDTSVMVNVLSNPIPIASGATVCLGGNVSLSASGGMAYTWSGPNNFSTNTQNVYLQNINTNQTGNYTVIVTGSNSCSSYTTVNLQGFNFTLPNPTIVATTSVCVNSNISLQGSGGVTYSWTGPNGFNSSSSNMTLIATHVGMTGTYTLSVMNASYCVGSNTVFVQVYPLPSATLISSQNNLCVPFCSEFSVLKDPASAPIQSLQYYVEGKLYHDEVVNACITQAGEQKVNVYYSDANNCSNTSTLFVNAYPKPRADFEYFPSKPIASIDRVEFTNRTTGSNQNFWAWMFNSGDSLWGEQVSFLFEEAGTYPVVFVVSNEWNCLDTVIKSVKVLEDFALYVPNAFTPNGDGLNDVFRPISMGLKNYHLEIYNRWGHVLFITEDFSKGWDGYFNGELCQDDVYSYKIIYSIEGGKTFEKAGWLMLER